MQIQDIVTHGSLLGSEKIYATSPRFPHVSVEMRCIPLTATRNDDGTYTPNPDVIVYDTGAPTQMQPMKSILNKDFPNSVLSG